MTDWINRNMILPASQVDLARQLSETLTGPAGSGMWTTGLSADGTEPATHYVSAGLIDAQFAALMPLNVTDEEGNVTTQPGNATVLAGLATEAGLTVTLDQVQALLDAAVVTDGEPLVDMAQAGLQLVAAPEVA